MSLDSRGSFQEPNQKVSEASYVIALDIENQAKKTYTISESDQTPRSQNGGNCVWK